MGKEISISSLNCRGLANKLKRLYFFQKLKGEKKYIILLQDMLWYGILAMNAKYEWGNKIICSPLYTTSRGTAILINDSTEYTLGKHRNNDKGNFSLVEVTFSTGLSIVLGLIYGPKQDNPGFYRTLQATITNFENTIIIFGSRLLQTQ